MFLIGLLAIGNMPVGRTRLSLVVLLGGLLGIRLLAIGLEWRQLDLRTDQALKQLDVVPRGSSVFPVIFASGGADVLKKTRSLEHIAHWRTPTDGLRVSNLFSVPGVQPLVWRSPPPAYDPRSIPEFLATAAHFEFVWSYAPPPEILDAATAEWGPPVATGDGFTLWRTHATPDDFRKWVTSEPSSIAPDGCRYSSRLRAHFSTMHVATQL
jgi:hypothetical protein